MRKLYLASVMLVAHLQQQKPVRRKCRLSLESLAALLGLLEM